MNGEALKQLELLGYAPGDRVCFRGFFPSNGDKKDAGRKADSVLPNLPKDLRQWEREGRGIYVVVNPGGQTDAEISQGRAVFYEHDDLEKEVSADLWRGLGLPEPTFQLDTSNKSVHSYWVLTQPISPDQWRNLQTDLLEFSDGDRSLKNPSRVMRLAGFKHPETGVVATIISQSGNRYDYENLRAAVPGEPQPEKPKAQSWADFDRSFSLPWPDSVPLEVCLSKANRALLDSGFSEGGRNSRGATLARDLIGTAAHLQSLGQRFSGDARGLFERYCDRCSPPLPERERESIWRSAESSSPGPALSPDQIEGCVKGWAWRERRGDTPAGQTSVSTAKASGAAGTVEKPKLSWEELKERLTKLWEIPSESEQWLELQTLAQQSHYRVQDLKELALKLKTPPPTTFSEWAMPVGEFLKLDLGADEDLLEGFLPSNRLILISSKGGMGKTLLAYDLVAALADGVPWCGFRPLRKHKVIIIQADESKGDCQERLKTREVNPDNVFTAFQFTPAFLPSFKRWVQEVGATVVLFDSLTSIQRDSGLSYKDPTYGNFLYDLKDMGQELGVTPIVITHLNKSNPHELGIDSLAGHHAVGAAASEIFVVDRPKEGKNTLRVLNRIKSRKYEREAYLVELNPEDYTHSFEGVCHPDGSLKGGETDTGEINGSARDKVKAYLAKNPGVKFQPSELSEALGISENTIRLQLSNLFRQHLIKREKAQGRGNQPYQYWLPLPKLHSELADGEVLRLINLASSDLEAYHQQVAQLPDPQKEQLYSEMPTLRGLERC